jgi:hypothetical protein
VQDDDDMTVQLPAENPLDDGGVVVLADGSKLNLFRTMCIMALIEGKIYKWLYSARAFRLTANELLNIVGELDQELEDWKDNLPIFVRPDHEINTSNNIFRFHIILLHLAYYNCVMAIHRMSIHHGYWTSRRLASIDKAESPNPRVLSSAVLCLAAARASINLSRQIPQGNTTFIWYVCGLWQLRESY